MSIHTDKLEDDAATSSPCCGHHKAAWAWLPRELLLKCFQALPTGGNERARTVAAVCHWWRCVALHGPGVLTEINLNRSALFRRHARHVRHDYFDQRISFVAWLLPRASQLSDLTLTADRGLDESADTILLRLAVAELAGKHLRRLKAISSDNGKVTSALLAAATHLQALEIDFWGANNAIPRGIAATSTLTSLKLQCSSSLGRTTALAALTALQELVIVDSDWRVLPPELLRLSLTRLHLRFADLEEPGWLPSLTQSVPGVGSAGGAMGAVQGDGHVAAADGAHIAAVGGVDDDEVDEEVTNVQLACTLQDLTLEGCQLRAVPPHLTRMSALTSLCLDRNYLAALPDGLSALHRLHSLSVESCPSLATVPPGLALRVESLNLLRTNVAALPHGLGRLTQLSWGIAAPRPVALDLASLAVEAPRLVRLRLDNVSAEAEVEVGRVRRALAPSLQYLRVNSAVLLDAAAG